MAVSNAYAVRTHSPSVYHSSRHGSRLRRAYQISEGVLFSPAEPREDGKSNLVSYVSVSLMQSLRSGVFSSSDVRFSSENIAKFLSLPLSADITRKDVINTMETYSPVVYFPQAVAAFVVRNIGGTAGQVFYAMRIMAAVFSVLCMFWAIRLLPAKGLLLFMLGTMPMFMYESASVAADAVVFVCILGPAFIISLTESDEKLSWPQIAGLLFLSVIIGLSKHVYGVTMLLYFLIPYKRMGSVKRYLAFGVLLLGVYLASSLV